MHERVVADDVPGLQRSFPVKPEITTRASRTVIRPAAIPGLQVALPIAVEAAGGYNGEVERRGGLDRGYLWRGC